MEARRGGGVMRMILGMVGYGDLSELRDSRNDDRLEMYVGRGTCWGYWGRTASLAPGDYLISV